MKSSWVLLLVGVFLGWVGSELLSTPASQIVSTADQVPVEQEIVTQKVDSIDDYGVMPEGIIGDETEAVIDGYISVHLDWPKEDYQIWFDHIEECHWVFQVARIYDGKSRLDNPDSIFIYLDNNQEKVLLMLWGQ